MKKILIEGRTVEVYHKRISKGGHEYVVHNDKLYQKVGSQGTGNTIKYCLEKESTNERFWIGIEDIKHLKYVIGSAYLKV